MPNPFRVSFLWYFFLIDFTSSACFCLDSSSSTNILLYSLLNLFSSLYFAISKAPNSEYCKEKTTTNYLLSQLWEYWNVITRNCWNLKVVMKGFICQNLTWIFSLWREKKALMSSIVDILAKVVEQVADAMKSQRKLIFSLPASLFILLCSIHTFEVKEHTWQLGVSINKPKLHITLYTYAEFI